MRIDQLNLYRESDHIRLPDELLECCAAFTSQPDAYPDLLDNLQSTDINFSVFSISFH